MDYLIFAAGLVTGYLVVRGLRSFGTKAGCLVLVLWSGTVEADQFGRRIKNTTGASITINGFRDATQMLSGYSLAAGGEADVTMNAGSWNAGSVFSWKCSNGYVIYSEVASAAVYQSHHPTLGDIYLFVPGVAIETTCSAVMKGKESLTLEWCNDKNCDVTVTLTMTPTVGGGSPVVVGPVFLPQSTPQSCFTFDGENPLGKDGSGNGIPFTYVLMRTGCLEDDYLAKVIDSGDSDSTTVESPSPDPNSETDTTTGDRGDVGAPNGDTNRTGDQVLHDDLNALNKRLGELLGKVSTHPKQDEQTALLGQIAGNMAPLTNGWGTNDTELLKAIKTNTHATAEAASGVLTNLSQWMSAATNLLSDADSISIATYAQSNVWANWEESGAKGSIDSITNTIVAADWTEAGDAVVAEEDALDMSLPALGANPVRKLSLNPFKMPTAVYNKWVAFCNWCYYWLSWFIIFWAFWMCWNELQGQIEIALVTGAQVVIPPLKWDEAFAWLASGGTFGAIWFALKKAFAGLLAAAVTVIIGLLPTIVVAILLGWGYSPLAGKSLPDYAASAEGQGILGPLAAAMLAVIYQASFLIPWTLFFTAVFNVAIFRFYCFSVLMVVCWILRFLVQVERNSALIVRLLIVGLWLSSGQLVEAVQVQVENWSGSVLSVTNESAGHVFQFAVGSSELNLSSGDYLYGSNSFEVVDTSLLVCLRFVANVDTNGPPVVCVASLARSQLDTFLGGFYVGLTVFGFAWAVAVFREGVLQRLLSTG